MSEKLYRSPTDLERAFLRVVTRGYPELESQIESCEMADYDPTGWCYVRVRGGTPSPIHQYADGPSLITGERRLPDLCLETILWTNEQGILHTIEIVNYLDSVVENPLRAFVDAAAKPSGLKYRNQFA
jgi:hypothetical protein